MSDDRTARMPLGDKDHLTEQRLAAYDDPQAATRAMLALDAGQMGSWRWDVATGTVVGDPFLAELFGLDYDAQPWGEDQLFQAIHPDDFPKVMEKVDETFEKTNLFEAEFRNKSVDPKTGEETYIWLGGRASVTRRSSDGKPAEMIGVNWDITDRKAAEQHLKMLAREMNHRVKNAFSVIRALVNIGSRNGGDKESFAETLSAQVQAMADAHQLLAVLASEGKPLASVRLHEVLNQALKPWLERPSENTSIVNLVCPEDVMLDADQVSPVSMLIYELMTNATKHGALGEIGGTLDVSVLALPQGRFKLTWMEIMTSSDALNASAATKTGFGSKLLSHCISQLGAESVKRELGHPGLFFEITIPRLQTEVAP